MVIGSNNTTKMPRTMRYFAMFLPDIFLCTKNKIDRAKNIPNPSTLTIVATAATMKERYGILFLFLRNNTKADVIRKINKESVTPRSEFCIK